MAERGVAQHDAQAERRERLAAELRANLKKRKAQARARLVIDEAALEAGVSEDGPSFSGKLAS